MSRFLVLEMVNYEILSHYNVQLFSLEMVNFVINMAKYLVLEMVNYEILRH